MLNVREELYKLSAVSGQQTPASNVLTVGKGIYRGQLICTTDLGIAASATNADR
jgi:hypothetical protein